MPKVTVELGEEMFAFPNMTSWTNKAQSWFRESGVPRGEYIAIDAVGRVCEKGLEFMRADKENTYPITVYRLLLGNEK